MRIIGIVPAATSSHENRKDRVASFITTARADTWNEHVAFSNRGDVVAVAGEDALVRFWSSRETSNLVARPVYHPLRHPTMTVRIAFSPDDSKLAVIQWDGSLAIWKFPTRPPEDFRLAKTGPTRVAISPDGRHFLLNGVSYRDCTLVETRVHDTTDGRPVGGLAPARRGDRRRGLLTRRTIRGHGELGGRHTAGPRPRQIRAGRPRRNRPALGLGGREKARRTDPDADRAARARF